MHRAFRMLFFLFFLSACTSSKIPTPVNHPVRDPYNQEVSKIILTYAQKWRFEKEIHLDDSVVFYDGKIRKIRLDFSSQKQLNLWEARKLLVDVVEELLSRVNENDFICFQLEPRPFTAREIELYVRLPSFFNQYIDLGQTGLISLREGRVHFLASDTFDCDTPCWNKRSEYYWQTKDFVEFTRDGEEIYGDLERVPGFEKDHPPPFEIYSED